MALTHDSTYLRVLSKLVQGCLKIVYGTTGHPEDVAPNLGPSLIIRAFDGLTQKSSLSKVPKLLQKVALPAFRSAVKAGFDQIILQGNTTIDLDELEDTLAEIDEEWYLGIEDSVEWSEAIRTQVPNLFSVIVTDQSGQPALNQSRRQVYRSHMLRLQECSVKVGRLNSEVVRSLWASLSWELLYLTNDDDERYSIQAEERLLKNLTVEVADPPLGYPAFTSKAIRHGLEYF